jgi:hypothetical protein
VTFFVWGWWRGFLSQLWALTFVLAAFGAANALGAWLEPAVAQIAAPPATSLPGAAWACAFSLVFAGLQILGRLLVPRRPRPAFPRLASRIGGSLLAGFRGVLLLMLAAYVFLEAAVTPAAAQRLGAESDVLALMPPARRRLADLLKLPDPIQRQAHDIEGWMPDGR